MFCDEVIELIEAMAAGDRPPEARISAHLATCANCAAALDSARQVERLLTGRTAPRAPAQFTAQVVTRVRRERWRREQWVDAGFNVALTAVVLLVVMGLWVVMQQTGLVVSRDTLALINDQIVAFTAQVAPSLPMYGGAAGVLAGALGLWWWAERNVPL